MIHLSKLLRGGHYAGDSVRFPRSGISSPPVVVWHLTSACNLRCRHCYAAEGGTADMEDKEAIAFIDALAELKPPTVLLSGGEPLACEKFFEYVERLADKKIKVSLSTNGTLVDERTALFLKEKNVGYVGVSIDGDQATHDIFRGEQGAFERTLRGIENLKAAGCRVGLRFTLARTLLPSLPSVMKLAEDLEVDRICFYHFIPSGRAQNSIELSPTREETRAILFRLFEWVDKKEKRAPTEVLTVGNFADGILLYLHLKQMRDARADAVLELLSHGKGGRSGHGILSIRWDGSVFADQFSWGRPLGRWTDIGNLSVDLAKGFKGRCGRCRWVELCRGNMRARAVAVTGDLEGEDPGCPLSEEEI